MNFTASETTSATAITTATRSVKLRAVAQSSADAEAVLAEWRALYGARLSWVREPRQRRRDEWLVYADLQLASDGPSDGASDGQAGR